VDTITERNGYTNVVHYTDDGWSGANFDQSSWKQLVKDIEDRKVSTVLVKDMRGVGRDYLQVGFYTEVMFRENQTEEKQEPAKKKRKTGYGNLVGFRCEYKNSVIELNNSGIYYK
jgi:hypothetical protein